mgnify:CR=1 FL=1
MIFNTNLEAIASRIPSTNMIQHLKTAGWHRFETKREDIAIYQYTTGSVFEQVTVPLDNQLSDFSYAMLAAAKGIAAVEGKPVEQMILEFLNPNADITRVRLVDRDIEIGSVFVDRKKDM